MRVFHSDGLQNVLWMLQPRRGSKPSIFPTGIDVGQARIGAEESPSRWLVRCVDNHLDGNPERFVVETEKTRGLAVLANINATGKVLQSVHIHALVVLGGNITDLHTAVSRGTTGDKLMSHYFRLDFDLRILGDMFRQPVVHIHVQPSRGPLFGLTTPKGNLILDFFDFLYRTFFYERWLNWARDVWDAERRTRAIDDDRDPWSQIEKAYKNGEHVWLRENQSYLRRIDCALQEARDNAYTLRAPLADIQVLAYPSTECVRF